MPPNAAPGLVLVAHGTASPAGTATTMQLVDAVAQARPSVEVHPAFLDVSGPFLADVLAELGGRPAVVVPALLSTGYHVLSDIPAITSAYPSVVVAAHFGPHPLVVDAVSDRLREAGGAAGRPTLLVAAGSSRPQARDELLAASELLSARLAAPVSVATLADDLRSLLDRSDPAKASARAETPEQVATYLLAEGEFADRLTVAVSGRDVPVAAPIGVHPAIVQLVWRRFDDARVE